MKEKSEYDLELSKKRKNLPNVYDEDIGHKIITEKYLPPEIKAWAEAENIYLNEHITQDSTLVDFGCGFGRHLKLLKDTCSHMVGIDHSPSMLKECGEYLGNKDNIDLLLSEGGNVPLADNLFDFSVCISNTLGNVYGEEQVQFLREMLRVTKPGGRIIVSLYSEHAPPAQKKLYHNVGLEVVGEDSNFVYINLGFKSERFTKKKITALFAKAGLSNLHFEPLTDIAYMVDAVKESRK